MHILFDTISNELLSWESHKIKQHVAIFLLNTTLTKTRNTLHFPSHLHHHQGERKKEKNIFKKPALDMRYEQVRKDLSKIITSEK